MPQPLRLALDQWRPVTGGTVEALGRLDAAAARARTWGADVLIAPEMALTGYCIGAEAVRAAAQPLDGPMVAAVSGIARRHGLAIVTGLPEAAEGRVYNAAIMVGADGALVGACRKTHLFGAVDRAQFSAGEALSPVFPYRGWRLALGICFDVEFPETVRALALHGVEALLVPTANMTPYESVARRVVPTRAEENGIFVAYANYVGREAGFSYYGLSCICGPDGADLARAGTGEEMILADIDPAQLAATRAALCYLDDRRPELYGALLREDRG